MISSSIPTKYASFDLFFLCNFILCGKPHITKHILFQEICHLTFKCSVTTIIHLHHIIFRFFFHCVCCVGFQSHIIIIFPHVLQTRAHKTKYILIIHTVHTHTHTGFSLPAYILFVLLQHRAIGGIQGVSFSRRKSNFFYIMLCNAFSSTFSCHNHSRCITHHHRRSEICASSIGKTTFMHLWSHFPTPFFYDIIAVD